MSTDNEDHASVPATTTAPGLITRPQHGGMPPAVVAEQQRAKSEIEAALTIAAARPRDQADCLDRILTSCQRQGVAEGAEYSYAKGGTAINGASVRLLEVVAQQWGNVEFGFRELARYPARGSESGESVVEAFAWDLETNVRRKVQFTVKHEIKARGATKQVREERDIYELMANMAQRRVRTCLETVIPRDITDEALAECKKTLKANVKVTPETITKMIEGFGRFGVTKKQIEERIQRHIDGLTPAQFLGLRKIWSSIDEGMSEAGDWFKPEEDEQNGSAVDKAKAAMKKRKKTAPEAPPEPPEKQPAVDAPEPVETQEAPAVNEDAPPWPFAGVDLSKWLDDIPPAWRKRIAAAMDVDAISHVRGAAQADKVKLTAKAQSAIVAACDRIIRAETG